MSAKHVRALLLGIALVVGSSGCIADGSGEEAVSTTAVTVPDSVPPEWADLELLLPDESPAGFEKASDDIANAGAIDVPRAVEADGEPDAQAFFAEQAFQKGYQRRFADGTGSRRVDVWVYEFAAAENASAWFLRTVTQASEGGAGIEAGTIPNAAGGQRALPDGTVAVIAYPAGNRVVRVESQDPDADTAAGRARDVAQQMLSAVPAPTPSSTP